MASQCTAAPSNEHRLREGSSALTICCAASIQVYALVHLAQHLAVKNATGLSDPETIGRAAYAGHAVLNELFPWRFYKHDAVLAPYAAALTADQAATAQAAGRALAVALIGNSLTDGFSNYVPFTPAPPGGPPGAYQFTPNQTYALYPQLATTRPFVITNVSSFDLGPPLALSSPNYTTQLGEVYTLGAKGSPARNPTQNDTIYFWVDGATTSAITGHFNTIAQTVLPSSLPLETAAEAFAKANVAAFDASIAGWAVKYKYLFWRPITAIRQGDGTPANAPYVNASWNPEVTTPPHPEYASGHQYSSASIAAILDSYLGTDNVTFTIGTEFPGLAPRTFNSLSQAVDDVGNSRVWAGLHFRKSIDVGNQLGRNVAAYVLANWDKTAFLPAPPAPPAPVPTPPAPAVPKPPPKMKPPTKKPPPKKHHSPPIKVTSTHG